MQKLLVLARSFLLNYFFKPANNLGSIRLFLILLGVVLSINFLSLIYQFNDLAILDAPVNLNQVNSLIKAINIFNYISYDYSYFILIICLVLSFGLIFLITPFWSLLMILLLYSSLLYRLPTFLLYQWDMLLIEVSFFSLFFLNPKQLFYRANYSLKFIHFIPLMLLMVRLFFHSGMVKLLSNDMFWLSLSALDIHLYSQPLPHFLSFFFHHWIVDFNLSRFFVYFMFLFELLLPFGLFFSSLRKLTAWFLIFFQILIILTGNFGYFNFLVIVPLVLFYFLSFKPSYISGFFKRKLNVLFIFPIILMISFNGFFKIFNRTDSLPFFHSYFNKFMVFKNYGLFARMTTEQKKFQLFLSNDLQVWDAVHLKYFDTNGYPTLRFSQPYLPRIRWQLWFKFLMPNDALPYWFRQFLIELSTGKHYFNSIVSRSSDLKFPYKYVKVCYQPIIFNINPNRSYKNVWLTQSFNDCYVFDPQNNQF